MLPKLRKKTWYTQLDLNRAYHNIPVATEYIEKTAISTIFGLLEFFRMICLCYLNILKQQYLVFIWRNPAFSQKYIEKHLIGDEDGILDLHMNTKNRNHVGG